MKSVSNNFKTQLTQNGREIDAIITYGITTLGKDDINSIIISTNGDILKSIITQVEIDSNVNIPVGTNFNLQFGLKVSGQYEYINLKPQSFPGLAQRFETVDQMFRRLLQA